MSTRICVLGNSHVAALKDGWPPLDGAANHIHADFAGCLKDGMKSFGPVGDKLGPQEEQAAAFFRRISTTGDFVVPGDYDAFILVGMKFTPNSLIRNYSDYATPQSNNHGFAAQMVSEASLEAALWDELQSGMMLHTARVLRAHSDAPVFVVWQPFLSEALLDIEWRAALFEPILNAGDGPYLRGIMDRIDARLEAEGFNVLRQPEASVKLGIMTRAEFSEGSRQFREGGGAEHRAQDVFHMNDRFGALCWKNWLEDGPLKAAVSEPGSSDDMERSAA